jgi:hypothetical protein
MNNFSLTNYFLGNKNFKSAIVRYEEDPTRGN